MLNKDEIVMKQVLGLCSVCMWSAWLACVLVENAEVKITLCHPHVHLYLK